MNVLTRSPAALLAVLTAIASGCDTGTGFDLTPSLVQDTVVVAAPLAQNAGLPTALDVTGDGTGVRGGRFPERSRDALQWDFAVRVVGDELVLLPAGAVGVEPSRAAITPPIAGTTFEGLEETPGQSTFVGDSAITMVEGAVYAARSRDVAANAFSTCTQFAKLQPLEVDVEEGLLRVQIVTNQLCGDARLVPADD